MKSFADRYYSSTPKPVSMWARISSSLVSLLHTFLLRANPFWLELLYFLLVSCIGLLSLKASRPRLATPKNIDLFFTSVSATTVSSMSTLDMEVFSSSQLVFMTLMMFVGGEVFTSMLGLHLTKFKLHHKNTKSIITHNIDSQAITDTHQGDSDYPNVELGKISDPNLGEAKLQITLALTEPIDDDNQVDKLKLKSITSLIVLVSVYLLVVHLSGSIAIYIYITLIPSAHQVLKRKGLSTAIFPIFTTVSSFSNCGYVPTNENMMVFKKNSGLLLLIIPQILMGNTLYPVCLRLSIWIAAKFTNKKELRHMLENSGKLGYDHLLSRIRCVYLGMTGLGFVVLQLAFFCSMEWMSKATEGLNGYQKLVASLFQVVNSRHAGELVFDLSAISSAILVLFVFMMYLPPYTSYLPIDDDSISSTYQKPRKTDKDFLENVLFSQLTYLTIFVILICITERDSMRTDPLNFNALNVVIEVISAYGNVGFSVGYSCARQIQGDGHCKDASYGFAGRWSNEGKFVLIIVMFFGRLKKFTRKGGRAWTLQ